MISDMSSNFVNRQYVGHIMMYGLLLWPLLLHLLHTADLIGIGLHDIENDLAATVGLQIVWPTRVYIFPPGNGVVNNCVGVDPTK